MFIFTFQSWDTFFRNASAGAAPGTAYTAPPSLAEPTPHHVPLSSIAPAMSTSPMVGDAQISDKVIDDHLAVQGIIRAYQVSVFLFFCISYSSYEDLFYTDSKYVH